MADKKISALTAATTPLAGTEVLPIVQSGSTVKVSVSNLTAGRAISMYSITPPESNQPAGGNYYKIGTTAFASAQTLEIIILGDTSYSAGTSPACRTTILLRSDNGSTITGYFYGESAGNGPASAVAVNSSSGDIYIKTGGFPTIQAYARGSMSFTPAYADTGSGSLPSGASALSSKYNIFISGSSALEVGTNVSVISGNLVVGTAGKGIDFSANTHAAGMTSELLNWYEEGTFTPTYGGSTTNPTVTYSEQVGRYTRIGRVVTIGIRLVVTSATGGSGNLIVNGLPFTGLANTGGLSLQFVLGFGSNVLQGALSGTSLVLYDTYAGTSNTQSPVSALTSAGGTTYFVLGGTYMV